MSRIKQYLSYIWDIPIERSSSAQNEILEVSWSMGRKVLNSKNANYSFGSGYRVFEHAFKLLDLRHRAIDKVLVLGFGAGSVEYLLRKDYAFKGEIVGVEYDQEIIRLYNKHFGGHGPLDLHPQDAKAFVQESLDSFDLVIIDLFDDLSTVHFVYEEDFTKDLFARLSTSSALIYNTVESSRDKVARFELIQQLSKKFKEVQVHEFQDINRIIIAK